MNSDSLKFLHAYFGDDLTGVYVCDSSNWQPQPAATAKLDPSRGWYFCGSRLSRLDAKGQRVKENALLVYNLTVDDVGKNGKIDKDDFKLIAGQPFTAIETSPDNWQCGFRLNGITPAQFDELRRRLPWKADGVDCVHWWRLPGGVNPKPEHGGFKTGRVWYGLGSLEWLAGSAGLSSPGAPGAPRRPAQTGLTPAPSEAHLEALMKALPNDEDDRTAWTAVGHALRGAGGTLEMWLEWCGRWSVEETDPAEDERAWDSFHGTGTSWPHLLGILEGWNPVACAALVAGWAKATFDDGEVDEADPVVVGLPKPKQLTYAEDIIRRLGHRLRWNVTRRIWHEFDGFIWRPLEGRDRVMELSIEMALRAPPKGKGDADVTTAQFHAGVEAMARRMTAVQVRQTDFDTHDWLLGTPGGTVDLRTGVLRGAVATDLISRSTAVAPAHDENCPRWKKFLGEATQGDKGSQKFLQQWAGYCLTGRMTEAMFVFLYGTGRNGKSVFCDTLSKLWGSYFAKAVSELFIKSAHGMGHTSKLAMLAGTRLVVASEVPADAQWNETLLKDVTGGGMQTAAFKHRDEFTFEPKFKLLIYGNHQPTFPGGIDAAIQARFKMMPFTFVPPRKDKQLMTKLEAEWPGILRWAINGCRDWAASDELALSAQADDFTREFMEEQDLLSRWISERIEKAPGENIKASDLHRAWIEWRNGQGEHHLYGTQTAFGIEIKRRLKWNKRGVVIFTDIRIKPDAGDVFGEGQHKVKE